VESAAGRNVVEVIENKGINAVVCADRRLGFREVVATKRNGTRMERVATGSDVRSSSATLLGCFWRFTRVLECLKVRVALADWAQYVKTFGHADDAAGEPELLIWFIEKLYIKQ
jgi:hypothetical protein